MTWFVTAFIGGVAGGAVVHFAPRIRDLIRDRFFESADENEQR